MNYDKAYQHPSMRRLQFRAYESNSQVHSREVVDLARRRNVLALTACSSPVGAAGGFEVIKRPILEFLFCLEFIVSLVKFHI